MGVVEEVRLPRGLINSLAGDVEVSGAQLASCYNRSMQPIHHTCAKCGTAFTGRARRKYCSSACARADRPPGWNKGMTGLPANRPKDGEDKACELCGTVFYVQKSRAGREKARFCSTRCYSSSRWNDGGKCLCCGKPTIARYCSAECQYTVNQRKKQEANWRARSQIIADLGGSCARCGLSDIRVLELNHLETDQKVRPKDGKWSWSRRIKDWRANLQNLEVLCANCHRLHTWEQRGFGVGLVLPDE